MLFLLLPVWADLVRLHLLTKYLMIVLLCIISMSVTVSQTYDKQDFLIQILASLGIKRNTQEASVFQLREIHSSVRLLDRHGKLGVTA